MARKLIGPTGSRRRRWWYVGTTLVAAAFFTVFFVVGAMADTASGCDFSPANNGTQSCAAPLTGSTFAGGDGNVLASPTAFGSTDWQNVAGIHTGVDQPSGSGDNSFGQGTKTDNANVSVVSGSIPNNKSDLTRFYEASEVGSNSDNFLYLAFERANVLGTANMNFEINQAAQPDLTTTGAKTLIRTAGDLLVTFDFTNGGGRPTIGILRWVTSATNPSNIPGFVNANVCFSANTFPCWGDQKTLDGTDSIAAVNNLDPISDPFVSANANNVAALEFGETAIDLTAAGVFPSGTCTAFGSTMVTSRSAASFTSEVKDFVAPVPVNISNCGSIKIIKHTDSRGQDQKFSYTSNLPAEAAGAVNGVAQGGVTCPSKSTAGVQSDGSFCLNDAGNSTGDSAGNTVYNNALQAGTYTVTEGADPSGYTFEHLSCTGGSATNTTVGKVATIHLAPGDAVTCTYINQQNTATIATQSSSTGTVFPGTGVSDTATVTGSNTSENPSSPPNVTFYLCAGTTTGCSSTSNSIGTGALSGSGGVSTATSPAVNTSGSPLAPGNYCFGASWGGDTNYPGTLNATSATNECFTVSTISTTVVTTPSVGSNGTTTFGNTAVTDSALITAAQAGGGAITGTVTFSLCDPTQVSLLGGCPTGGHAAGSTTTLVDQGTTVPSAVAVSPAFTNTINSVDKGVNMTGTWCWRAVYTPGGANGSNYTGNSDSSTTECFTVTDTFSNSSQQSWMPNDSAVVSTAHGAPLNGTLDVQLYTGDNCGATSGGKVSGQDYQKTLTNATAAADRTLTTNNTSYTVSASASVSWLVTFTSTDANVTGSTHCEVSSLTITN